ncbi:lipocalin family protein [Paraburkholderia sp. BCC1885]|uniref:lipocalin family protein n=1 Tax=Paraburkholderia sp. BCC1885 TaxID=2562669 RepID=UPI001184503E|nr:lipocalin family protein [Paraburkholderia sp. BCC1885]
MAKQIAGDIQGDASRLILTGACAFLLFISGCAAEFRDKQTAASTVISAAPVDLPRYMGRWYVIANVSYLNERNYVGSYERWTLLPDGKVDDAYFGRLFDFNHPETGGALDAMVVSGTQNAEWRIRLFWPMDVDVVTVYVDADYQYTIRCLPDKSLIWILSRDSNISDIAYASLLSRLRVMGFDTSRIKRVPQRPEQIGKPGFHVPQHRDGLVQ